MFARMAAKHAARPLAVGTPVSDTSGRSPDADTQESRRNALWVLAALGILAVLVLVVMLGFSSGGGHHNNSAFNPPVSAAPSEPASTTALPTSAAARSTTPAQSARSTTPASRPLRRKPPAPALIGPCPSPAPCAVPGDHAQLVAAVNAFRAAHQLPTVPGTVSPQAQQCALAQGTGPACAPSDAWQPVPAQSAAQVIAGLAARDDGKWLLDPSMVSFSVGWAYAPGARGAPGQWESAILKIRGTQQDQQDQQD
jgi:hypothetical protein